MKTVDLNRSAVGVGVDRLESAYGWRKNAIQSEQMNNSRAPCVINRSVNCAVGWKFESTARIDQTQTQKKLPHYANCLAPIRSICHFCTSPSIRTSPVLHSLLIQVTINVQFECYYHQLTLTDRNYSITPRKLIKLHIKM